MCVTTKTVTSKQNSGTSNNYIKKVQLQYDFYYSLFTPRIILWDKIVITAAVDTGKFF